MRQEQLKKKMTHKIVENFLYKNLMGVTAT